MVSQGGIGYNSGPMTTQMSLLALLPAAYLAGSVPFGLVVGLSRGVDPRKAGSGNIGATNVGRLLGVRYFVLVFVLDMLKGLLPTAAASWLLACHAPAAQRGAELNLLHLLIGLACILGHMFSLFLRFKGGKGVATSAGVALGVYPFFTLPALAALAVFGVVFAACRYMSLASIVAAWFFPLAFAGMGVFAGWDILGHHMPLLLFSLLVPILITVRHRSNIARLRAGTESRFSGKSV